MDKFDLIEDRGCGFKSIIFNGSFADCRDKKNQISILQRKEENLPASKKLWSNVDNVKFEYSIEHDTLDF